MHTIQPTQPNCIYTIPLLHYGKCSTIFGFNPPMQIVVILYASHYALKFSIIVPFGNFCHSVIFIATTILL